MKMGGKGLIESSTIKIRLSVHAEDLELIREKESRERERERMIREKEREKQARALASQQVSEKRRGCFLV